MKQSDLKILIKKVQNECALEEPTKITYYWNDEGKLVFKLFFDSLIIPEELMVDEDNISKCFSEQNVYEFEDDFVIKELNREKGFVEIIPDDQKFKVINSYKDYNEDAKVEKDHKEESVVRLAGNRISEDFARAKGFILQESQSGTTPAGSEPYNAIVLNAYMLNNASLPFFTKLLEGLAPLGKKMADQKGLHMKIFINVPQTIEKFAGFETYANLIQCLESRYKQDPGLFYILNTKRAEDVAAVADKPNSVYYPLDTDVSEVALKTGIGKFSNKKNFAIVEKYIKNDTSAIGITVEEAYKKFIEESKKSYEIVKNNAEFIIKEYLKMFNVKEADKVIDNLKTTRPEQYKIAEDKYNALMSIKDPENLDWRVMCIVENLYSIGENVLEGDVDKAKTIANAYKKSIEHLKNYKIGEHGAKAAIGQAFTDFRSAVDAAFAKFLTDKSAGAAKSNGGDIWQKTDMEKGASAAGTDFGKAVDTKKEKGKLFNKEFYLNLFTFYPTNDKSRANMEKELARDKLTKIAPTATPKKAPKKDKGPKKQYKRNRKGK